MWEKSLFQEHKNKEMWAEMINIHPPKRATWAGIRINGNESIPLNT